MNGFNYTFLPFSEVHKNIQLLLNYSIIDITLLLLLIILLIAITLYGLPLLNVYLQHIKAAKLKAKNKKMIKSLALQKDIEDAIAEELRLNK